MKHRSTHKAAPRRQAGFVAFVVGLIAALVALVGLVVAYVALLLVPKLPPLDVLTNFQPKVPLRVYTADHVLIGEFGEERRSVVKFADIPQVMKQAVLATEDSRFYEHGGVDYVGVARAAVADVTHGGSVQGGGTITMQVARNFFLTREKTATRKIYEMMMAYKIEHALSKDQILELYMNQIYLGQRAYGFASASRVYFGKDLREIDLAQAAMLAGLPKAPSANNPVSNPKRARQRQEYILQRMLDLEWITKAQYNTAMAEPIHVVQTSAQFAVHGEYVAEMVRQTLYAQYKDDAYTHGYEVTTTVNSVDQNTAYKAVRTGVMDYDHRHGYRGPEGNVQLPDAAEDRQQAIDDALEQHPDNGDLLAAVVLEASAKKIVLQASGGDAIELTGDGLKFAANALKPTANIKVRIVPGSIVRINQDSKGNWQINQLPQVEGALIALAPDDGAIRALVGGFEADGNKFNHVTQAWRQPGSTFKPFIYSAALEKGLAPATLVNDAPFSLTAEQTGNQQWDPKDDDEPEGPITLRRGLEKSKNLVAIRTLNYITPQYAQEYASKFGFDPAKNPAYLTMALGAGAVTPLQLANGYAVFANGGYKIAPWLIAQVSDARGNLISKARPTLAGKDAPRIISSGNAYIMDSLLKSVAQHGTAANSNILKRTDLAGKTGTTNDALDGWFAGYQHSLVAVTWVGYDQPRSLGSREFGAQLALPLWITFMDKALHDIPQYQIVVPDDVTMIDGQPYLADKTPGNGFIASVDVSADNVDASEPAAASAPEGDKSDREKILDLFK